MVDRLWFLVTKVMDKVVVLAHDTEVMKLGVLIIV